jgi:hypothetical protein
MGERLQWMCSFLYFLTRIYHNNKNVRSFPSIIGRLFQHEREMKESKKKWNV